MKIIKRILIIIIIMLIVVISLIFGLNYYVKGTTKNKIVSKDNIPEEGYDCILVLGAGLRKGKPSPVLQDRLDTAIELYEMGIAPKIIMSGDHGKKEHDEVNVMKKYAIEKGVPSEDIFMDHAGFSTYDSIYRAKEIFEVKNTIIVTQEYHLYRSLYIAKKLGLDGYGVSATLRSYQGESAFYVREVLARDKDFVKTIFKPESKYLGDPIPVSGDGNITNDTPI